MKFWKFPKAYIDVILSVITAILMLISHSRNFSRYHSSIRTNQIGDEKKRFLKRQLFAGLFAILPFLIIIPTMKLLNIFQTMVNTVVNDLIITTYDPRSLRVKEVKDDGDLLFELRNTTYAITRKQISSLAKFLNESSIDYSIFRPRSNKCVSSFIGKELETLTIPAVFSSKNCLNAIGLGLANC